MTERNENELHRDETEATEDVVIETPETAASIDPIVAKLEKALADTEAKASELHYAIARERTNFAAYKRRVADEKKHAQAEAKDNIIGKILPILDRMEEAIETRKRGDAELDNWAEGVELIIRKFNSVLEAEGIVRDNVTEETNEA